MVYQTETATLICLPFAGAGVGFYRQWARLGVPGLVLVPILLPGRERRISESPYISVESAVDGIFDQTLDCARQGGPFALFGHSLGAVLAYELTWKLVRGGHRPVRLFVSGSMAPGWPIPAAYGAMSDAGDDDFVAALEQRVGYQHEGLHTDEVRRLVLPALRADVQMHTSYRTTAAEGLPIPVTVMRGADDPIVSHQSALGWRDSTAAEFDLVEFDGGHMYLVDSGRAVLGVVARHLRQGRERCDW